MSRTILHRVRFVLIACIAMLALPAAAFAVPPTFHGTYEFTDDAEICGVSGTIHGTGTEVVWDEGGVVKVLRQGQDTFTADDGRTAQLHFAGPINLTFTENEDGTITIVEDYRGLAESISGGRGGPVLRDAGLIVFTTIIDATTGDLIDTEITVVHGPHPEADSDFTIFCDAFLEALGE